jgi:Uma2 family endonuclease
LAESSEPQPDCCLYISSEKGGQTKVNDKNYLTGPPELIVEIASSTESNDLHSKKRDYERAGVREYVVVAIRKQEVFWFVREGETFAQLPLGDDGIYRSRVFPGLWLDPAALLRLDSKQLRAVLDAGCAADEHAKFVEKLAN